LAQMVFASAVMGLSLSQRKRRQQKRSQNGDNGDCDKELGQCEARGKP